MNNDWLFDEQGRMRADLPPVYYPFGLAPPIEPPNRPQPDFRKSLRDKAPKFGGWDIRPKRWNNPTPGEDWHGLYGETPIENVPFLNHLFGYR